jgi:glucose/mannose transport system permease protein
MIEAARIDGAGIMGVYWKILFPLSLPGFVVVIIWQFTNIWNEFLFAVTILQKPELQPITVALRNLSGSQIKEWNVVMAGTLIAALPTLLIYIVMGRFFIRGLRPARSRGKPPAPLAGERRPPAPLIPLLAIPRLQRGHLLILLT